MPFAPALEAAAAAAAAELPRISLQQAMPRGFVIEPHCPVLDSKLCSKRVVMRGVGGRGPSWCWGIIKRFFKSPEPPGYFNYEIAWGGGSAEIRDARLSPIEYGSTLELQEEMPAAWVLLRKG